MSAPKTHYKRGDTPAAGRPTLSASSSTMPVQTTATGRVTADYSGHRTMQAHQHIAMVLHETGRRVGPETQVGTNGRGLLYSHNDNKGRPLSGMGLGTQKERWNKLVELSNRSDTVSGGDASDSDMVTRAAQKLVSGLRGERGTEYFQTARTFLKDGATFVPGGAHAERNISSVPGGAKDDLTGGTKVRCFSCAGHLGVQEVDKTTGDGRTGAAFAGTPVVPAPTRGRPTSRVTQHDSQRGMTRARSLSPGRR